MQKLVLLLLLLIGTNVSPAQQFHWARRLGTASIANFSQRVLVDPMNAVITLGHYSGVLDVDPGPGVVNLPAPVSGMNTFIQKLDVHGQLIWGRALTGQSIEAKAIACDPSGNLFLSGNFQGTVDMNPHPLLTHMVTSPLQSGFILKLNASGDLLWVKVLDCTNLLFIQHMALDPNGHIALVGYLDGTVDADPGPGIQSLSSVGLTDLFIARYTPQGDYVFAHVLGNSQIQKGVSVAADSNGDVICTGHFQGVMDFNPGPATFNLGATFYMDIFILKLNAAGQFIWAKNFNGTDNEHVYAIKLDHQHNMVICGDWVGSLDFDPGPGTANLGSSAGNEDGFLLKLDSAGNFKWVRKAGNFGIDRGTDIAIDTQDRIYFTGQFYGTCYFTPTDLIFGALYVCTFVAAYDSNGIFSWAAPIFGNTFGTIVLPRSISLDQHGGLYVCGDFVNAVDFDPSPTQTFSMTPVGAQDIYTLKLQAQCGFTQYSTDQGCDSVLAGGITWYQDTLWFLPFTDINGCDSNFVYSIQVSGNDTLLLTQTYCDSLQLGIVTYYSSGTYTQVFTNSNGCDSVVTIQATVNTSYSQNLSQTACGSYTMAGVTYTASGLYTQSYVSSTGCDSSVHVQLVIHPTYQFVYAAFACDSLTYNGVTYTNSGTYTQNYLSVDGCDSIWLIQAQIGYNTSNLITDTACQSFTLSGITYTTSGTYVQHYTNSSGCDSSLTLQLTIHPLSYSNQNYTQCDSITLGGITYTSSGIYTQVYTNSNGCDSIITINLNLLHVNAQIAQSGSYLSASPMGASYQWLRCTPYQVISGATSQNYLVSVNGDYAVSITHFGCTDTSACITVTGLDLPQLNETSTAILYPNPAHDFLYYSVDTDSLHKWYCVNIGGQFIPLESERIPRGIRWNISQLPSGIYFIKTQLAEKVAVWKFIKE